MVARRESHAGGTRKLYDGNLKRMAAWLGENGHGDCVTAAGTVDWTKVCANKKETIDNPLVHFFSDKAGPVIRASQLVKDGRKAEVTDADKDRFVTQSCLGGYSNAVQYGVTTHNRDKDRKVAVPENVAQAIKEVMNGHQRCLTTLKSGNVISAQEGRDSLSFPKYSKLMRYASHDLSPVVGERDGAWSETLVFWPFCVLLFNLCTRPAYVGALNLGWISWKSDSMVVIPPEGKCNKLGEDNRPRHLFANPFHFHLCPITALAVYVASLESPPTSGGLFNLYASKPEQKISHQLASILKRNQDLRESLGDLSIGTYTFRKTVISYLLDMLNGPSPVAVYYRAEWSLGDVKERYITLGGGADQVTGRAAAGLPECDPEFGVLPPHFSPDEVAALYSNGTMSLAFPHLDSYPMCFRDCIPFLFAMLVHWNKKDSAGLRGYLPTGHPFFNSLAWQAVQACPYTPRVCIGRSDVQPGLMASGVPGVVRTLHLLEDVRADILKEIAELPGKIVQTIADNYKYEGVQTLPREFFQQQQAQLIAAMDEKFSAILASTGRAGGHAAATGPGGLGPTSPLSIPEFEPLTLPLPSDWEFPRSANAAGLFHWWLFGDPSTRTPPLRVINQKDIPDKRFHADIKRCKQLMALVEEEAAAVIAVDATLCLSNLDELVARRDAALCRRVATISLTRLYQHVFPDDASRFLHVVAGTTFNHLEGSPAVKERLRSARDRHRKAQRTRSKTGRP